MPGMSQAYDRLLEFLDHKMRMSHVYQPVMLEVLLVNGGSASIAEIAAAFLAHDESQAEYYEQIVKKMPGPVLTRHGVVQRSGQTYALTPDVSGLTTAERKVLIRRCQEAVQAFKAKRGATIWEHRRPGLGVIPGRVRYDTLKRARFRCELCGISADERALDVDHILPKAMGGSDEPDNLQALCWKCNTNKGAGDDADFRRVAEAYAHRDKGCLFCAEADRPVLEANDLAFLIADAFPVTEGHLLAIPRRHVVDYFDMYQPERNAIQRLLEFGRGFLLQAHPDVTGFNVGINAGQSAGQTVLHCHVHLIPRRTGDVAEPRGGVRGVIPVRSSY